MVWIGVYNYFALKNVWNKTKLMSSGSSSQSLPSMDTGSSVGDLKSLRAGSTSPKPDRELELLLPDDTQEQDNSDHIV